MEPPKLSIADIPPELLVGPIACCLADCRRPCCVTPGPSSAVIAKSCERFANSWRTRPDLSCVRPKQLNVAQLLPLAHSCRWLHHLFQPLLVNTITLAYHSQKPDTWLDDLRKLLDAFGSLVLTASVRRFVVSCRDERPFAPRLVDPGSHLSLFTDWAANVHEFDMAVDIEKTTHLTILNALGSRLETLCLRIRRDYSNRSSENSAYFTPLLSILERCTSLKIVFLAFNLKPEDHDLNWDPVITGLKRAACLKSIGLLFIGIIGTQDTAPMPLPTPLLTALVTLPLHSLHVRMGSHGLDIPTMSALEHLLRYSNSMQHLKLIYSDDFPMLPTIAPALAQNRHALRHLDLYYLTSNSSVADQAAAAIANIFLRNPAFPLETLNLSGVPLTNPGFVSLASVLRSTRSLRRLDLMNVRQRFYSPGGDHGVAALGEALGENDSLLELNMRSCFDKHALLGIARGMARNRTLLKLDVSKFVAWSVVVALIHALRDNPDTVLKELYMSEVECTMEAAQEWAAVLPGLSNMELLDLTESARGYPNERAILELAAEKVKAVRPRFKMML